MVDTEYRYRGQMEALADYGIDKQAGFLRTLMPTGRGVAKFMVGQPKQFFNELAAGKALHREGLVRRSLAAPGLLNKLFFFGFPAWEAVKTVRDPQGDKAARLGGIAGSTLLGSAAFLPFGMVGAMGAGMAGDAIGNRLGAGVGHLFGAGNRINPSPNLPPSPPLEY